MRLLFIGDIVARPGREVVKKVLPQKIKEYNVDFVVANADNLAHGRGATEDTLNEMMGAGVNFFTSGDHVFWHKGFKDKIDNFPIIRPANYPHLVPGKGYDVIENDFGKILIISLMGQTFINEPLSSPFLEAKNILSQFEDLELDGIFVDFHAEATSDKNTMGFFLDGKVDVVVGSHTHVPTCDQRVFPKGTMFVSDIGMTGNIDSVLGVKKEIIIDRMVYAKKQRFEWELEGRVEFRSILVDTVEKEIIRVDERFY